MTVSSSKSDCGSQPAPPCTLAIFGARGDLTKRLLMPALYDLAQSKLVPDDFEIVGLDHNDGDDASWRAELTAQMHAFTKERAGEFHPDELDATTWNFIASRLRYRKLDFEQAGDFDAFAKALPPERSVVFYLAVAARFFGSIVDNLGEAKMLEQQGDAFRRVIIEKPFGDDLASAQALNARILTHAGESQIYRIDHFLGKEAVQSIMALRFANGFFEPMWRREHVSHVQISAAETLGVEHRASFYEQTGALRDMIPNHLFQLLAMTAMEPPNSFAASDVRDAKGTLIAAVEPVDPARAVRGQYTAGEIAGDAVAAYRGEDGVAKDSAIDTYAALELRIENWRWSGVPFYLRTGKRLATRITTIDVHFKPAPYLIFRDTPVDGTTPNVLTLQIDPERGMSIDLSAKVPGPEMQLGRVTPAFRYADFFAQTPNVGYETLLYDCMRGDATLFQRADHIEGGWAAVQPVLDAWAAGGEPELYPAGSAGPAAADALLAHNGDAWRPLANDLAKR